MSGVRVEPGTMTAEIWRDPARPAAERVADLLGRMTLAEKVAQLTSIWVGDQPRDANVAPMQGEMSATPVSAIATPASWVRAIRSFSTK